MVNLKEELKDYIDDGSINWRKLSKTINYIISMKVPSGNKVHMEEGQKDNFLSKVKDLGQISFQFIDKGKGTRQRLVIKKPSSDKKLIMVESVSIEPIVDGSSVEAEKDGTPMWVDNEWYRSPSGRIFRCLGRKSYIKDSKDYQYFSMKDVDGGSICHVEEGYKDTFTKVIPEVGANGKTVYVAIERDV